MEKNTVLKLIDRIVEETGLAPSTVCQKAIQDPHLHDRMKRRDEQDKGRIEKLQKFRATVIRRYSKSQSN
ncbi:MAG: hypothetical protein JXR13_20145 [Thalassovita sp.]